MEKRTKKQCRGESKRRKLWWGSQNEKLFGVRTIISIQLPLRIRDLENFGSLALVLWGTNYWIVKASDKHMQNKEMSSKLCFKGDWDFKISLFGPHILNKHGKIVFFHIVEFLSHLHDINLEILPTMPLKSVVGVWMPLTRNARFFHLLMRLQNYSGSISNFYFKQRLLEENVSNI